MNMQEDAERAVAYQYPAEEIRRMRQLLQEGIAQDDRVYVVIDDDPTGGQTVHDIEVYTAWDEQSIWDGLTQARRMFYIMTNSRSLTARDTAQAHRQIMENLKAAAAKAGRQYEVISRGDSTLRGHFPLEPDVIAQAIGGYTKQLLIPYFKEGDRYTAYDTHYLRQDGSLIPVGESEFSRDKTFGYHASDLKDWIQEKTGGATTREEVASISLEMLRRLDFRAVEAVLRGTYSHIVVNATCDDDLRVFAIAYLRAVGAGEHYVARTAAGWPKIIGDIPDAALLGSEEMVRKDAAQGGLVVVGSHVQKTSDQLVALCAALPQLGYLEFDQHLALDPDALAREVQRVSREVSELIRAGRTCVVYTRRQRMDLHGSAEGELQITRRISDAITAVVGGLSVQPRFILTKGGITSSDIAVHALGIRQATIMGQAAPGVPVWKMGEDSKYPGMAYIIFPGNVGGQETLRDIVERLL